MGTAHSLAGSICAEASHLRGNLASLSPEQVTERLYAIECYARQIQSESSFVQGQADAAQWREQNLQMRIQNLQSEIMRLQGDLRMSRRF